MSDDTDLLFDFPCEFPVKIMGESRNEFANAMAEIILRHAPEFEIGTMEMRASSSGKYVSLTCTIRATSRAQLDALYLDLTGHPWVKVAL